MISLAAPLFLLALPLPLIVYFWGPRRKAAGPALEVPFVEYGQTGGERAGHLSKRLALPFMAWISLVVAMAEPQRLFHSDALPISGRDLIVALDLSGSMIREDFTLNGQADSRLNVVKAVGSDFVRKRGGDRVALLVFGSKPYFATPFSYDVDSVADKIEEAVIGISGRATNMSGALGLALKRFETSDAASKVVIFLSDGENTAGNTSPLAAARLAKDLGVRVHTIALGVDDKESAPTEQGVVDAKTLNGIADISGGESFRVRTTEDLVVVANALDRLESTDRDGLPAELFQPLWIFPAMLFFGLTALLIWRGVR